MDVTAVIAEMKRQAVLAETRQDPALSAALWKGVLIIEDLTTPNAPEEESWLEN